MDKIGIVVLAAGKGTRLNCTDKPKVMLEIGNKPIVSYIVEMLKKVGFAKDQICLVIGFEKQKVKDFFGDKVIYADQDEQLGTAHAAHVGMKKLPDNIEQVLVLGGDDSAFYTEETLKNFINKHLENNTFLSLLTAELTNPVGIGRVIRDQQGNFVDVIEKEEMTEEQKSLKEISTGTYCFNRAWFEEIFPIMTKIPKLEEFGLPQAVEIAQEQGKKMQVVKLENNNEWFGINTPEELEVANNLKSKN